MPEHALIVVTCGSDAEARQIGNELVAAGLVAGTQMLPIESVYLWEGDVVQDEEWLLICKTRADRYQRVAELVEELHSYEIAPIYMLEMSVGSDAYLSWIDTVTSSRPAEPQVPSDQ